MIVVVVVMVVVDCVTARDALALSEVLWHKLLCEYRNGRECGRVGQQSVAWEGLYDCCLCVLLVGRRCHFNNAVISTTSGLIARKWRRQRMVRYVLRLTVVLCLECSVETGWWWETVSSLDDWVRWLPVLIDAHTCTTPVKHILTERISHKQTRQQCCLYNNLKDIFNHSPTKNILNFIKNTNLHNKL